MKWIPDWRPKMTHNRWMVVLWALLSSLGVLGFSILWDLLAGRALTCYGVQLAPDLIAYQPALGGTRLYMDMIGAAFMGGLVAWFRTYDYPDLRPGIRRGVQLFALIGISAYLVTHDMTVVLGAIFYSGLIVATQPMAYGLTRDEPETEDVDLGMCFGVCLCTAITIGLFSGVMTGLIALILLMFASVVLTVLCVVARILFLTLQLHAGDLLAAFRSSRRGLVESARRRVVDVFKPERPGGP